MIRPVKALFFETGTYDDMFLRPYHAHVSPQVANEFNEITNTGLNIRPGSIAPLASSIIQPSLVPQANVNIAYGWGERRFRFIMEFMVEEFSGHAMREFITGYTDQPGALLSGAVDQGMHLYINGSLTLRSYVERASYGGNITRTGVREYTQVINKPHDEVISLNNTDMMRRTMRPEDVVGKMGIQHTLDDTPGNVLDFRQSMINGPKLSVRQNCQPANYLSRIITSMNSANNDPNMYMESNAESYDRAKEMLMEPTLSSDIVIGHLNRTTGFMHQGYVTYKELCRAIDGFDHVATFMMRGQLRRNEREAVRGMSEGWQGSTMEVGMATILSNVVPSMMMGLMISKATIIATNRTIAGEPSITIDNICSFSENIDMRPYLETFHSKLRYELMPDITKRNQLDVSFALSIDLIGDTFITVSVNGGPNVEYTIPSFCDSLMTPVVAIGPHAIDNMAYSIDNLFNGSRTTNGFDYPPVSNTQPITQSYNGVSYNDNNGATSVI